MKQKANINRLRKITTKYSMLTRGYFLIKLRLYFNFQKQQNNLEASKS